MISLSIVIVVTFFIAIVLYKLKIFSGSYYKGQKNEYFDGIRFKRIGVNENITSQSIFSWLILRHFRGIHKEKKLTWEKWKKEDIIINQVIPEERVIGDKIKYYFINHSTVLIQTNGVNIITDPIYSDRAGKFIFGPRRVHEPGISFDNLPKIDLILLSHSHYDHFNNDTLLKLFKKYNPLVITPVGNDYLLKKLNKNFRVIPLLWDESTKFENLKITIVKAYHWSRRDLNDSNKTLWGGFIIETPGKTIYFAGDTAFGNKDGKIFKEIAQNFKNIDLSFLPIGAYIPYDFMRKSHTSPEDSVIIHKILNTKKSIAIHFGTFQLSGEKRTQPIEDLKIALMKHSLHKDEFIILKPGESGEIK